MAYTTIDDPSVYFQTKVYTGNSADVTAHTNDGNANLCLLYTSDAADE